MTERKLFVPALPPVSPGADTAAIVKQANNMLKRPGLLNNPGVTKVGQAFQMGAAVYEALPPGTKAHLRNVINRAGTKVSDTYKFTSKGGPRMHKGSNHSSGYSLSKAPNPIDTNLDTGIVPNIYTSDYLDAESGFCSPLHLTSAKLEIPTGSTNPMNMYFNKVIAFDLQSKAQANIGFNLNVNTDFSSANILAALNALINALSIYHYYMSIISYHSDPANKNEGMIDLRTSITPQMLEDLSVLGRRLADTPCPPRLLEFVRYFYGNYFSGNNQGSPILKLVPFALSDTMVQTDAISTASDLLTLSSNNQVYTLLRRSVPHWRINELRDVHPTPAYDENFKTIFANLPFTFWGGSSLSHRPHAASTSTTIPYNSYSNNLDGAAYAMCGVFVTNSTNELDWLPGLVRPVYALNSTNGHSRRSYYSASPSGKLFYAVTAFPFLNRSRQETFCINDVGTDTISVHLAGTDRVKGVCQDTILETSYNTLDYLMSLESIKSASKQSGFNPAASRGRSRK